MSILTKVCFIFLTFFSLGGCTSLYYLNETSEFVTLTEKALAPLLEQDKKLNDAMTESQLTRIAASDDGSCRLESPMFVREFVNFTSVIKSLDDETLNGQCNDLLMKEKTCLDFEDRCYTTCYADSEVHCIKSLEYYHGFSAVNREIQQSEKDKTEKEKDDARKIIKANYPNASEIAKKLNIIQVGKYQRYDTKFASERALLIGTFLKELAEFSKPKDSTVKKRLTNLLEKAENLHKKYYEEFEGKYPDSNGQLYDDYSKKTEAAADLIALLRNMLKNAENRAKIKEIINKNYANITANLTALAERGDAISYSITNAQASTYTLREQMLVALWDKIKEKEKSGEVASAETAKQRRPIIEEYNELQKKIDALSVKPTFVNASEGIKETLTSLQSLFNGNPSDEQKKEIFDGALNQFKAFVTAAQQVKDVF